MQLCYSVRRGAGLSDGRRGTLLAAARHNIDADGEIDGQIVEVWLHDQEIGPKGAKILEYPIARTMIDAPKIARLAFVGDKAAPSTGHGELSVGFDTLGADSVGFTWTWGENALLDRACDLLKQFSERQICELHDAVDRHSAFFAEISRAEEGIIKRNNELSKVCAGALKVTAKDCEAGAPQRPCAVAKVPRNPYAPRSASR